MMMLCLRSRSMCISRSANSHTRRSHPSCTHGVVRVFLHTAPTIDLNLKAENLAPDVLKRVLANIDRYANVIRILFHLDGVITETDQEQWKTLLSRRALPEVCTISMNLEDLRGQSYFQNAPPTVYWSMWWGFVADVLLQNRQPSRLRIAARYFGHHPHGNHDHHHIRELSQSLQTVSQQPPIASPGRRYVAFDVTHIDDRSDNDIRVLTDQLFGTTLEQLVVPFCWLWRRSINRGLNTPVDTTAVQNLRIACHPHRQHQSMLSVTEENNTRRAKRHHHLEDVV